MHYQQVVITVPQDQVDVLSDALIEHGALSTAIEDANAGSENEQPIFGEPDMPTEEVWQQSNIVALFDEQADINYCAAGCSIMRYCCACLLSGICSGTGLGAINPIAI